MRRLRPGSCFYSEGNASGLGESGRGGARGRSRLCFLQGPAADEAYFIAKEMLATERTYLKDLEVLTVVRGLSPGSGPTLRDLPSSRARPPPRRLLARDVD